MKKILTVILALMLAISCFAFVGCGAQESMQSTLDLYIFDKEGQTLSEEFVLPGTIGNYKATWTSDNDIIELVEIPADRENGIERQYTAKVGLPEERTEVNLTVAITKLITKTFTVYVNPLSVYDFSGSYNFIYNNGTVVADFALDTTCEYKDHTASIAWSVDAEYADYLEISADGATCLVFPSSLNPKVKINATFTYNGESTTKAYRMTVSEQKEPLQEVDYWYTNTGVGIKMSGYVVSIATVYSSSYKNVSLYMVNDEFTAGYYLYRVKTDDANAALLAPGVHVTVTGTTNTNYNGLMETNAGGSLVVDGDMPTIDVNEHVYAVDNDIIGGLQSAYYNQARLVSLTNWTVKTIKSAPDFSSGTQTLFVLTKGGVDVPVVISKYYEGAYAYNAESAECAAFVALQGTVKEGDVVSLTGILSNYNGHQIAPLSASAVVIGGTADPAGTVYAGQKAAKAVKAIDKIIVDNGLDAIVAVSKNIALPATLEGCEVTYRLIGSPRSMSIADGALVINPAKLVQVCLTATITVDGFSTTIFRYISTADLDDAGKVEMEVSEFDFKVKAEISSDAKVDLPANGSIFEEIAITWTLNGEAVSGSVNFVCGAVESAYTLVATFTLNGATQTVTYEGKILAEDTDGMTIAEFNAIANALGTNGAVTEEKYTLTGTVTEIANTTYGNLYIEDASGKLYIYGLYNADGTVRFDAMENKPAVGDVITVYGVASYYNGAQMKNAWLVEDAGEDEDKPFVEGQAYHMYLNQLTNGTTLYFNGQTESASVTYRLATVESTAEAAKVYFEYVSNGLLLYFYNAENVKTYIKVYERTAGDPGYGKGSLEFTTTTPDVAYTWDETLGTLVVTNDDGTNAYYLGTYSNYVTMSVSNTSYITGNNAGNLRVSQFPAEFVLAGNDTPAACEHEGGTATCKELAVCTKCGEAYGKLADHAFAEGACSVCGEKDPNYVAPGEKVPTIVTNVEVGVEYKIGIVQENLGKTIYATGAMSGYYGATTDSWDSAMSVYVENAEGGYYLYGMVSGAKKYIGAVVSGTHKNYVYQDTATTVFTFNTEYNTFTTELDGTVCYMGTYGTYNTFSVSTFDKITTSFPSHLFVMATAGGDTPAVCEHEGGTATCKELAVCTKCGEAYGEYAAHVADTRGYSYNAEGHWYDCINCQKPATEAEAHSFVEGKCACGAKDPNYVAPEVPVVGGGKSDFETIEPPVTSGNYTGGLAQYTTPFTSASGWTSVNAALLVGGTTDANPVFKFIGADNTVKAITINGKVGASGVLTSPVLSGGISKLSFNYGHAYSDKNGVNINITITEVATGATQVINFVVAAADIAQKTAYLAELTLDTPVAGDFTIVFTNNSPTNKSSGNADRVSLWNIEWTGYTVEVGCAHEGGTATCKELAVCAKCGEAYGEFAAHAFADATCQAPKTCSVCGETEGELGDHAFADATCTAPKTCSVCGETEGEMLGHVDADLDIECDREGCTSKVAPANNSLLSNKTANLLGSKLSTSNTYYVEGTIVEVLDQKNGIFLIDDGTGETFYFRLPKNAEGVSHASWEIKLTLGDKVQVYGKINKYSTSQAPNGQYYPAMQSPVVTLLEQHAHDFTISATCSKPAYCVCGQSYGEPLDCVDANGDSLCDYCGKNVNYIYEYVEIRTDNNSGVLDSTAGTYTWGNDNFSVQVAKSAGSQLYTTSKDHMRLYKGNQIILASKNDVEIKTIVVYLTNATQVANFEKFLAEYTYTKDETNFTVTVEINATTVTFTNPSSNGSTTQIKGVEIGYEKPAAECAHEWKSIMGANAEGHWLVCALCEATGEIGAHEGQFSNDGETHSKECGLCGYMIVDGEAHTYTDGACACGAQEPVVPSVITSIADALKAGEGDAVELTGIVSGIYQAYNASYGNISVYISDGTNEILAFRMTGEVKIGDEITVTGVITMYNSKPQIAQGCTFVMIKEHVCEFDPATCTSPATCPVCDATSGTALEHTYVDGACSACGASDPNAGGEFTAIYPENLTFGGLANKASADSYMKANYADWKITGKLGNGYAGYLGFGRSGDTSSAITSSALSVNEAFTITTVLKGNGSSGVATSILVFTLVDANGEVVAIGSSNGTTEICPADAKDTTYTISFELVEGKSWTDATALKISFTKKTGNIGLKSLTFNK